MTFVASEDASLPESGKCPHTWYIVKERSLLQ